MVSFGLKGRVQLAQAAAQPYSAQRSSRNTAQLQQYDAGHAKQLFADELREWLRRYEIEWDERYVWD